MTDVSPEITAIVPTFDRPGVLERNLRALSASEGIDFAALEVIVVDDGSPGDETRNRLERLTGEVPYRLESLRQENAGQARARNRAMAVARGRIWLFLNDDTIAAPGLVEAHLRAHLEHPEDESGVLGRATLAPEIRLTAARSLHLDQVWKRIAGRKILDWHHFWTTNVSVKAAFFRRHEIEYDPAIRYIHDDTELGQRLHDLGFRLHYHPSALGYHDHALGETEFLRMAEREARSLDYWARKGPERRKELARFGYTPAKPTWARVVKYPLLALVFNRLTGPIWCRLSRILWGPVPAASRFLLSQCYAARKRRCLARLSRNES